MKALKIIFIAAISILLIAVVVGYMQPRKVELQVSEVIQAPLCVVFDQVNDLNKRVSWSPWEQSDSTIVVKMGDKTAGLGASYSWTSEENGTGKLTYTEVVPNEFLKSELDFGQQGIATASFSFKEVEDGVEVTWAFENDMGGAFYDRIFGVIIKAIIDKSFNQGLANLAEKAVADTENPCLSSNDGNVSLTKMATILKNKEGIGIKGEIVEMEIPTFHYLSVLDSCEASSEAIGQLIGNSFGKIMGFMAQSGYTPTAAPIVFYHKWDSPEQVVLEPASLLKATSVETPEGVLFKTQPQGKVIMGTHMGGYDQTAYLYAALNTYLEENNLKQIGASWTEYITDPTLQADTNLWESRIYMAVE